MWSPATAVLWECWRLRSRRVLFVTALSTLCGGLLARNANTAPLAFAVLVSAAVAMAFSIPLIGTRSGFPFYKSFPRPIRTSVLVAVPFAYVCAVAAASYLVPASFLRVFMGAQFPLLPVAALVGALAALVAGCGWFARNTAARLGAAFLAYVVLGAMLRSLAPFREAGSFPVQVRPRLVVLSEAGYLALLLLIGGVCLGLVWAVGRQRHGDEAISFSGATSGKSREDRGDILTWVRDRCVELLRWRCPVSSPTAAEVWFELQYYGIPVLVIGAFLALCIPALMFFGNASRSAIPVVLAAITLAAPFMAAVSASIWNRHNSRRAHVSEFEAARPMGTARLIGVQILVAALSISGAWLLMSASFWISLPLLKDLHDYGSPLALAVELFGRYGMQVVSAPAVGFVLLATVLALIAAIRAVASSYGWRVWVGALGLALYSIAVAIAVARGWLGGAAIGAHIWAVAVGIPVGTMFVFRKILAGRILRPRQAAIASMAWLLFAIFYLDLLGASEMMRALPALGALALASTLLPLLAFGLAPWSLSLIRHG